MIANNGLGAGLEELAAAGQRDRRRGLEDAQEDRQITRVLRQLRLSGLTFLVEVIETRDDDPQKLDDDRRGDVRA